MEHRFCPSCAAPLEDRDVAGRRRRACSASCGYVLYENPLPVVAALVELEGDVILVRNHGWPESWFGLISGFLEKGETPTEGALRELREETGLEGEIVSLIGVYPFEQMNQVILAYHVRARGEVVPSAEIAAVKRVPVDSLRPWPFGTGHAVAEWLRRRNAP